MSLDGIAVDGVDRDTPGGRPPRAVELAARMRVAANDDAASDAFPAYAELHCLSDFSFLRGAASAEELFTRAQRCGYEALAITDECSLAGIVRAYEASRASGLKLIVGSEFKLADGLRLVLLVETLAGYTQLCELITLARRAASKGTYRLTRSDVEKQFFNTPAGMFALWLPAREPEMPKKASGCGNSSASAPSWRWSCIASKTTRHASTHCSRWPADFSCIPLATGDVHMDLRRQRVLQDTMTAIRHGSSAGRLRRASVPQRRAPSAHATRA